MLSTTAARGRETLHALKLKAGQLQHPGLGQIFSVQVVRQGIEQAGADVARHRHRPARVLQQAGPSSAVTVVLPLVPVMASTLGA